MRTKVPCVYIVASRPRGTLYTGVTADLVRRLFEHRHRVTSGFTATNNVKALVWFERHDSMESAIRREKQIKRWQRLWKISLVEKMNPNWDDLYDRC